MRSLGAEWQSQARKLLAESDALARQALNAPFGSALDPLRQQPAPPTARSANSPLRQQIDGMREQVASWFITGPVDLEDRLWNAKEQTLDKIRSFMSGPQKAIYVNVRAVLATQE